MKVFFNNSFTRCIFSSVLSAGEYIIQNLNFILERQCFKYCMALVYFCYWTFFRFCKWKCAYIFGT